jgi:hypothetical protein
LRLSAFARARWYEQRAASLSETTKNLKMLDKLKDYKIYNSKVLQAILKESNFTEKRRV